MFKIKKPVKYKDLDRIKINERIKDKFVKRVEQLRLKVYIDNKYYD